MTSKRFKPGNIYWVSQKKLVMPNRQYSHSKFKPVLIVATSECFNNERSIVNLVPLSSRGNPNSFRIPVTREDYTDYDPKELKDSQFALIQLYQPLYIDCMGAWLGELKEDIYQMIVTKLALNVIGYTGFDLSP